ncbi:S-norcoclaurine synthase 1-like protein [Carex littledalei]|uniref:S-norcoclaurine synthase 1-like protein n=1 Tax=Carex littledalei TaxID=544730 RepID=A0A833RGA3_9POAL|nr:S-norcoclaurine synthase 1-like protein [Carex littledalei]
METTKMKERPRDLGGSMKTRNVQALAADQKKLTDEIMERYIRPEMNGDDMFSGDSSKEIPVIDLSRLMDEMSMSREEEASKLKHACEEWGFFQLVNHGVPEKVIEEMKDNIKGFFGLPLEEREEVAQLPGDLEGYGQAFIFSEEQKLDWADMLYLFTQPPHFRNFKHWPPQPPSFRYKSIEHRAVINAKEERMSIAALHSPSFGKTVGPLAEIVDNEMPLFKSLSMQEYAKLLFSQKLYGKNLIELMKLDPS